MPRAIPGDWYEGLVADNVVLERGSYLETAHSVSRFRSQAAVGLRLRHGAAAYNGTMFDAGPAATIEVGRFALLNSVRIICDGHLEIGEHALISWNVVIMDSYRARFSPAVRPVRIGANVWIGFDSCILPGVTVGEGSIVGARSVVTGPVPPYCVVAGNPARVVRLLEKQGEAHVTAG